MIALRRLLRRHIGIVALLIAATLAIRLLVPAGFMPVAPRDGAMTVQICDGMGGRTMTVVVSGLPGDHGDHPAPSKADMPCAFAGLVMPMVADTDTLLLAIAFTFVLAVALRSAVPPLVRSSARLRPPLRGPPLSS